MELGWGQKLAPSFSSTTCILTGYVVKGHIINLKYYNMQGRHEGAGSAGGSAGRWYLACLDEPPKRHEERPGLRLEGLSWFMSCILCCVAHLHHSQKPFLVCFPARGGRKNQPNHKCMESGGQQNKTGGKKPTNNQPPAFRIYKGIFIIKIPNREEFCRSEQQRDVKLLHANHVQGSGLTRLV